MNENNRSNNQYTNHDHDVQFFNMDQDNSVQNEVMNLSVDLSSLENHHDRINENQYDANADSINSNSNEELTQHLRHSFQNKEEEYQAIQAVARAQGRELKKRKTPSSDGGNDNNEKEATKELSKQDVQRIEDPKKYCAFCKKHFSHQGSYGRHLDLKKGDELHPEEEVAKIRSKVIRRNGPLDTERIAGQRSKKKIASKLYNKREDVRERNKYRRKLRDRDIKARLLAYDWFLGQLGSPDPAVKTESVSFARLVCLHLPVQHWPLGAPPSLESFNILVKSLSHDLPELLNQVNDAHSAWQNIAPEKQAEIWVLEQRNTLQETLGSLTLFGLQSRKDVIQKQRKRAFESLCKQDNLATASFHNYDDDVHLFDSNASEEDETNRPSSNYSFQSEDPNYFENH